MKKLIRWSTPKYIQIDSKRQYQSIPGKSLWACKRSKGEHQLEFVEKDVFTFGTVKHAWNTYRCVCCGKMKYFTEKSFFQS